MNEGMIEIPVGDEMMNLWSWVIFATGSLNSRRGKIFSEVFIYLKFEKDLLAILNSFTIADLAGFSCTWETVYTHLFVHWSTYSRDK